MITNQPYTAKNKNSIAIRLLKTVFLFYMVITFVLTSLHMYYEYASTKNKVQLDLKVIGETFSPGLSKALWDINLDQMKPMFLSMVELPTVIGVRLTDENGKEIASSGQIEEDPEKTIVSDSRVREEGHFQYSFPLTYGQSGEDIFLGRATIYSNRGVVFERVKNGFILIMVNAVIKTVALWLLVLWVSNKLIRRPLEKLAKAVEELDLDKLDGSHLSLDTKGGDELNTLENAFNSMAGKLLQARKKHEDDHDEIDRSRRQFQSIVDNAPSVIFMKDIDGKYLLINDKFESLFHVSRNKVIGMKDHDIFPREMADTFRENDRKVAEAGHALKMEEVAPHDDGIHTYLSVKFPLHDGSGNIYAVCGIATDITERKEMEDLLKNFNSRLQDEVQEQTKKLSLAKNTAESANRAKSTFLANMSHDLRTPLNAIMGFAHIMEQNSNNPSDKENLKIIYRSGLHLLTLINQILDLSKIEAGHIAVEETCFDLFLLLEELENMLSPKAYKKHLALRFYRAPEVPRYICTDELKLRQILINILGNSIKFTDEGSVNLRISLDNGSKDSIHPLCLNFEVEDTGPGIAPEEMELLFQAFRQTSTGKEARNGTGLGLLISQKFVQLMGGDVHVTSEVGQGMTVKFDIQAQPGDMVNVAPVTPTRRVLALEPGQPRYRMLIVDDNQDNRRLLSEILNTFGFDLREAENGQEAIDICKTWHPHLIWMDIRMPVMDGYEATKRIRQDAQIPNPVIVLVTASVFEHKRETVMSACCDDIVIKPFKEIDIAEILLKHLNIKFLYADNETETKNIDLKNTELKISPADFVALPKESLIKFREAVAAAEMDTALTVIEDIREHNQVLANALKKLVEEYRFDKLQSLLDQSEKAL